MGHRDAIPEDPLESLRWTRNFVRRTIMNAKEWRIPDFEIQMLKMQYSMAKSAYEECLAEPEPPPEPHFTDGFTIYWDKKKRFAQLWADCFGISLDSKGLLDAEDFAKKISPLSKAEIGDKWVGYVMAKAKEIQTRYGLDDQWLEDLRQHFTNAKAEIEKEKKGKGASDKGGDDQMHYMRLFMFR